MKNLLVLFLILVTSNLFANSPTPEKQIAECKCPSLNAQAFLLQKDINGSMEYRFVLNQKDVPTRVLGPSTDSRFIESGNMIIIEFKNDKVAVGIRKGTNTSGGIFGDIGGEELFCNANWP